MKESKKKLMNLKNVPKDMSKLEHHIHRLVQLDNGKGQAVGPCYKTGEDYTTAAFEIIGYMGWILDKAPIQECLPELNDEDREFLISGLSPNGWHQIFGNEE